MPPSDVGLPTPIKSLRRFFASPGALPATRLRFRPTPDGPASGGGEPAFDIGGRERESASCSVHDSGTQQRVERTVTRTSKVGKWVSTRAAWPRIGAFPRMHGRGHDVH